MNKSEQSLEFLCIYYPHGCRLAFQFSAGQGSDHPVRRVFRRIELETQSPSLDRYEADGGGQFAMPLLPALSGI
jgi:hypothetical protein